jgi:hypothetical protein
VSTTILLSFAAVALRAFVLGVPFASWGAYKNAACLVEAISNEHDIKQGHWPQRKGARG